MKYRFIAGTVAVAAAAAMLAGCSVSGKPSSSGAKKGQTSATFNLYQPPATFNPLNASQGGEVLTEELIFDNLVQVNPNFTFQPRLATSWQMSPDGKTWTFHLHKGLKWSDGKPFSAADVLWTFNAMANPKVGSTYAAKFTGVVGYDAVKAGTATTMSGMTAPNPNTVVFKFTIPSPGFLASIAQGASMMILPQHILGSVAPSKLLTDKWFNKPTTGLGPYTITKYVPNEEIDLVKNPLFRAPVGIDKIYLKMLTSDVAEAQLQTGELDVDQVAPADLKTVEAMSGVKVTSAASPGFLRVIANDQKFPVAVRQALLMAIDRKTLIQTIYGGKADLQNSSFMTKWALPSSGLNSYAYDPKKAKAMLTSAGFDFSKSYTFEWVAGTADRDQAITDILQEWNAIGVKVKAKQVDPAAQIADIQNKSFDFTFSGGGTYTLDPESSLAFLTCANAFPAGGNVAYFCDKSFDSVADQAQSTVAQSSATPIWQKAAKIENQQVAELWLYDPQTVYATSTKLKGFTPYGDFTNTFADAYKWTIG